jgi:hypothetical protein
VVDVDDGRGAEEGEIDGKKVDIVEEGEEGEEGEEVVVVVAITCAK